MEATMRGLRALIAVGVIGCTSRGGVELAQSAVGVATHEIVAATRTVGWQTLPPPYDPYEEQFDPLDPEGIEMPGTGAMLGAGNLLHGGINGGGFDHRYDSNGSCGI